MTGILGHDGRHSATQREQEAGEQSVRHSSVCEAERKRERWRPLMKTQMQRLHLGYHIHRTLQRHLSGQRRD